jgi:small nuclear ribonucleoprotein (snRNP)-like protein
VAALLDDGREQLRARLASVDDRENMHLRTLVPRREVPFSFLVVSTKRCKEQGALVAEATGATEDAAARRVIAGQKRACICPVGY